MLTSYNTICPNTYKCACLPCEISVTFLLLISNYWFWYIFTIYEDVLGLETAGIILYLQIYPYLQDYLSTI